MGLDITHYKATFHRTKTAHLPYIGGDILGESRIETQETFAEFNVPFEHFKNYIQLVECPEILKTAIIVKEEHNLPEVKHHFRNSDYAIFLDTETLPHELATHEASEKLEKLNRHIREGLLSDWKIVSYYKTIQKEGIYFEDVGYQRKGMNSSFGERFCLENTHNYALEDDFTFALSCLEKGNTYKADDDFNSLQENFKKNFIGNFELGASFLSVSY